MDTLVTIFWILAALGMFAWAVARFYLAGPSLAALDTPVPVAPYGPPSPEHADVVDRLRAVGATPPGTTLRQRIDTLRERLDALGREASLEGVRIQAIDAGGVPAEWVMAEGADPARRVLYIHGGAFAMGSPRSHRALTGAFSRLAGAAVLAIDYRLIPEHRRLDCLADCQTAYRWILENGPEGPAPVRRLVVAGDSAGGNLTLGTIAWARDAGLRAADAAVALSPATDATLASPSLKTNLASDHMLGPQFGALTRLPSMVLLWIGWAMNRVRPCDPRVSPVYGNLAGLPPTLVHASESEMLLDDARRYVARARAAGSPASIQTWPHMVHVWQIFHETLPEGRAALEQIRLYLEQHAPR
jgi:acetyl esterase/lipase